MVSAKTHWASVLAAYLRNGEDGLDELADRLESVAHDHPNGTFSKAQARYLPQSPIPPMLWRASCGRCRFWEAGEAGEPGRCHIVGRPGDRYGGEAIHYRGWCAYWMPPAGEPAFAWVRERIHPDGKSSVRGSYDPELTEKQRDRQDDAEVPTEPDARRDAIQDTAGSTDGG